MTLICQGASALSVVSLAQCMQCLNPCRQACMPVASAQNTDSVMLSTTACYLTVHEIMSWQTMAGLM